MAACCGDAGNGSSDPLAAMNTSREKIMYVTCTQKPPQNGEKQTKNDYLATVDVDPESPTFCQVISRLYMLEPGDELHHYGWNACVSCKTTKRKYLVVPGFFSGNIHFIDALSDPRNPKLVKRVIAKEIKEKYGITFPHTVHCIPSGDVLIHYLGDAEENAKGNFLLFSGETLEPMGLWNKGDEPIMGHDYWYQPRQNIMISTEFGAPKKFSKGFYPDDVVKGYYGSKLHFWKWNERELFQTLDLGAEGAIPFEIRFLHNPDSTDCYMGTALGGTIMKISKDELGKWYAKTVVKIPNKTVKNWILPYVPALISDLVISLDDNYLFITNYLHGDVRMYDITDRDNPKLVSQVFIGGSIVNDTLTVVEKDEELAHQPDRLVIKGRPIYGGPHMMQLSRDGKRLYVTNSLLSPWDDEFYSKLTETGGCMVMLDVTPTGMTVNPDFLVDFGKEPDGAVRGHEMRYPGGDCTSDIWV